MIGMAKINELLALMRQQDWTAVHAMLDDIEKCDPDTPGLAHWRSTALQNEGLHDQALEFISDNLEKFNCKANALHKRAAILHEKGDHAAALNELDGADLDSEADDHWALVMEAKFFRLFLKTICDFSINAAEFGEFPDDYISILPSGKRLSLQDLKELNRNAQSG